MMANNEEAKKLLAEWIKTLPEACQKLAERYPMNAALSIEGVTLYVLGYGEPGEDGHSWSLILTCFNPVKFFEFAQMTKFYLCVDCFEENVDFITKHRIQ